MKKTIVATLVAASLLLTEGCKHDGDEPKGGKATVNSYTLYKACKDAGHTDSECDIRVFGQRIEEDDDKGRWFCDLRGNKQCGPDDLTVKARDKA
jgi:hypothetical protein